MVKLLLLSIPNLDVNQCYMSGSTPLFAASQNGHTSVVKLLLSHPDIKVNQGRKPAYGGITPLWFASQNGDASVVKLLLSHPDINVNQPDNDGCTPIYIASHDGHISVVKLLLSMGKDVDVTTKPNPGPELWRSRTPAEQAKTNGNNEIFELLKSFELSDDPIATRNRQQKIRKALRKELKIHVEDAAQLLALVVLLSDEYLQFQTENQSQLKLIISSKISYFVVFIL